jgi:asparagine synthase (glutamine-hydrolysing)
MCGITGIFSTNNDHLREDVGVMMDHIRSRGPDGDGVYVNQQNTLALGHTRLSIIDLSTAGAQPMVSKSEMYIITYNGELYNCDAILKILNLHSVALKGHSDTELLLELISLKGLNFSIQFIKGMYSFAVFDVKNKLLHIVRDRLGEKPVYYGQIDNGFVFSSDIRGIMHINSGRNRIDNKALFQYLKYNYVPAPLSIINGVFKLEPGELLTFQCGGNDVGNYSVEKYWNISCSQKITKYKNLDHAADKFEDLFSNTIHDYMHSDVKVGSLLSGGIDSTIIAYFAAKQYDINTYTLGFEDKEFDERGSAKRTANILGSNHTEYLASNSDIVNSISFMPQVYGEPFADSSQLPSYVISKYVSNDLKVCLAGDGGDELFLGYPRYKLLRDLSNIKGRGLIAPLVSSIPSNVFKKIIDITPVLRKKNITIDNIKTLKSILSSNDASQIYDILFSSWKDGSSILNKPYMTASKLKNCCNPVEDNMQLAAILDIQNYLPDDLLVKMDRASMAHSLEIRLPFLDLRVVNFAQSLHASFKYNNNQGSKALLKHILSKKLPREFLQRKKQGFSVPIGSWINGILKDWVDDLLSKDRIKSQNIFNVNEVHRILSIHRSGKGDYSKYLWSILMFQQWYYEVEHLLENEV